MLIPRVLLVPSSPTLLIDERRGNSTPMLTALIDQAARLEADAPTAIVVVSSRWTSGGAFHADDAKRHTSLIDMPGFGIEPRYDCRGEPALARAILDEARRAGLHAAAARRGADSGISVPLHFLAPARHATVVPVSVSDAPAAAHREWGACLRRAMTAWEGRALLVVSGALTFHQHSFNLNREIAEDRDLDALALDALRGGGWAAIQKRGAKFPGKSHPEAGWKHLEVLRGFLGDDLAGRLCAYEALPGIGEALVEFEFGEVATEVAIDGGGAGASEAAAAAAHFEPASAPAAPQPARAAKPLVRRTTGTWRARPPESASPDAPAVSRPRPARPSAPRPARPGFSRGPRPQGGSGTRPARSSSSRPSGYLTSRPPRSSSAGPGRSGPPRSGPPRSGAPRPSSRPAGYSSARSPRASSSGPSRSGPPRSGPPRLGPPRSGPPRSSTSRPPRGAAPRPSRAGGPRPPRTRPSS